ncbi:MAG TPA: hypothetical protein VFO57_12570 [Burkholderiales bacterium]|nr:hypothetical protein [Burkholderiales bacterium]
MHNYAGYKLQAQLSIAGYKLLDSVCRRDAPAQGMRRAAAAVKRAAKAPRELAQVMEKVLVIRLGIETRLAVIAALDDVKRNAGRLNTQSSRHNASNGCPRHFDDISQISGSTA